MRSPPPISKTLSSAVNICLATVLTDRKDLRITDIHHLIALLKQILIYRNAFLARIHKVPEFFVVGITSFLTQAWTGRTRG